MAKHGCERIGNYIIYLDQMYFVSYAGGSRELTKENQKVWDKTNLLPEQLQIKERNKIGLINNPNVVPIKGVDLLSFIKELGYIPFFDKFFNSKDTNVLTLNSAVIYESIKQKSYDIAMRG